MTAQAYEALDYHGERKGMAALPLEPYLESLPVKLDLYPMHTACTRCYQGLWEIDDGKLFLKDVHGHLIDTTPLTVELLFPGSQGRVLASWFSGVLRCPEGERLKYIHNEFRSKYERELLIEVENGIVKSERMIHNSPPAPATEFHT